MNKIILPIILAAVIAIAGFVAAVPMQKAEAVHESTARNIMTSIGTFMCQVNNFAGYNFDTNQCT
jgi:hypothetical protein